MELPPITPRGVLRRLSEKPSIGLRIARGWIIVGTLVAVFGSAMAVAHFVYGVPFENSETKMPATSIEIVVVTSALAGGGLLFVALGFVLRKWLLGRPNGS